MMLWLGDEERIVGVAPIHVLYPPNRHVGAKLRVFIDWAVDLFARTMKVRPAQQAAASDEGSGRRTPL